MRERQRKNTTPQFSVAFSWWCLCWPAWCDCLRAKNSKENQLLLSTEWLRNFCCMPVTASFYVNAVTECLLPLSGGILWPICLTVAHYNSMFHQYTLTQRFWSTPAAEHFFWNTASCHECHIPKQIKLIIKFLHQKHLKFNKKPNFDTLEGRITD